MSNSNQDVFRSIFEFKEITYKKYPVWFTIVAQLRRITLREIGFVEGSPAVAIR